MANEDTELIAATSELLAALDAWTALLATRLAPSAREAPMYDIQAAGDRVAYARAWVSNVLADRSTPVGTAPSPEYDPRA
jgi:predicted lipoprotein